MDKKGGIIMKKLRSVIAVILTFVFMISLTGCGEIKKAESAVNNMFSAFKSLDFDKAQKYVDINDIKSSDSEDGLTGNAEMFMKNLFNRLDHKIISSEKIDSDTVNVTTEITAVDMKPVLGEFFASAMQYALSNAFSNPQPTEEEINEKMEELFATSASKPDLATVTNQVVIKVVKQDKEWKVIPDDTFVDAILGGLTEAAKELENALNTQK
ncbi:MAG: DUF4878 domain-containing protein [Ruminococcaceae bacterium]|nr:DUF4878 domain-containing protein [Oscillospiraceae bacterium]